MFNMIQPAALHLSRFKSGFVWKTLEFNLNYFASRYPNYAPTEKKKHNHMHNTTCIAALHVFSLEHLHFCDNYVATLLLDTL